MKRSIAMPSYGVAVMRQVTMGPDIVEYLNRIDATLAPFGGHFIVHVGEVEVKEGAWARHLIVIEFPDGDRLRRWYQSPAYREILHLRTDNSASDVIFVEGVSRDHRATDVLG